MATQTPFKLTFSNYTSWKLQFHTLFIGYDLIDYIDGSKPCPTATLIHHNTIIPNPNYIFWIRQDRLVLNALVGSISPTIILFIAQATTSHEAWNILANTYAKPTHGHIKRVKRQLKKITKGPASVTEFLQAIKARADELALLGAPLDTEDLTKTILVELGDDYKELVCVVQARDTFITFDEFHEKLLNFQASVFLTKPDPSYFPATAHPTSRSTTNWRPFHNHAHRSSPSTSGGPTSSLGHRPSRLYLGHYQICRIQGHTAKRCHSFRLIPIHPSTNSIAPIIHSSTPWQPRANYAVSSPNPSWLLDCGASHHVTSDLHNLSLHTSYNGSDDIMIGDGWGLPITHTGSTSLTTSTNNFHLNNVLCVPHMKKNLISIFQFYHTNNISIEFLPSTFLMKDVRMGTPLLTGKAKDGVYEWPMSSPFLAFSSLKTSSSEWHHRLGHPAFFILKHIVSNNNLGLDYFVIGFFL